MSSIIRRLVLRSNALTLVPELDLVQKQGL